MTTLAESEPRERIFSHLDRDEMIRRTRELVEIPSPCGHEGAAGQYLAEMFGGIGLRTQLQEVEPNRYNAIGVWKGTGGGRSLMITGHMDTSHRPQEPVWVDGDWLFGPGATNMKACFTGAYAAVKMLQQAGVRLKGDLIIASVVGESETGPVDAGLITYAGPGYRGAGMGTEFLLRHGVVADMAIIGEPTGLRVQCGNAGYIFAKVSTFGKVQHTHTKHRGVSALDKMFKVAQAIQAWEPAYQRRYQHPRMLPLVNIGAITSGSPYGPNKTPAWAHLFVHINTIPGADPVDIRKQLEGIVRAAGAGDPDFRAEVSFFLVRAGYEIPADTYIAEVVRRAHEQVLGEQPGSIDPPRYSVSSDGPFFLAHGIPAITYGPGGISRSGARVNRDEVVGQEMLNFNNLANCAKVYTLAAMEVCGAVEGPALL